MSDAAPVTVLPPVSWFQDPAEFGELLALFRSIAPRRVLEIGTFYGGTLWQWIDNLQPGAFVVSVDLVVPESDPRHQDILHARSLWQGWASGRRVQLIAMHADSTDPKTVKVVGDYAPYDFIFVDGGHEYQAVAADFRNYFPYLRQGGIMAFHDIAHQDEGVEVDRFWHELKLSGVYNLGEIVACPGTWGIGVIYT